MVFQKLHTHPFQRHGNPKILLTILIEILKELTTFLVARLKNTWEFKKKKGGGMIILVQKLGISNSFKIPNFLQTKFKPGISKFVTKKYACLLYRGTYI